MKTKKEENKKQIEAEYRKITDLALSEYDKIKDLASTKYDKIRDLASTECYKITDLAWAEYRKIEDLALAEKERKLEELKDMTNQTKQTVEDEILYNYDPKLGEFLSRKGVEALILKAKEETLGKIDERILASELLIEAYEKGDDLESGDDPVDLMQDEIAIKCSLESLREDLKNNVK